MIHKSSPQSSITLNTHCFQRPMLSLSHSRRAWYQGWRPNRDSGSWYKPLTCTIWSIMKLQRSPTRSRRLSGSSGVALIPFSSGHYKKIMLGFLISKHMSGHCERSSSNLAYMGVSYTHRCYSWLCTRNIHNVHSQTPACGTVRIWNC